jgi:NAD(P)H-hydrate epimerase
VLTGITAGLLAQGLNSGAAALLAVHVHGMAGDMALETESEQSLTAGDIIGHLGRAFRTLSGSRVSD